MTPRILVINPNRSASCTNGIAQALRPLGMPGHPRFEVIGLAEGPPAVATWLDWHAVAGPVCATIAREPAAAYVIACVSDPGLEAARTVTQRPVFGLMRSAVAAALARAERFGIIGFVPASEARQRRVLQAMGVESRLAAWRALDLPMEVLTDAEAPRARLRETARWLAEHGAEVLILGCAGMAGHAGVAADAAGVPVIEPCRAAAVLALAATLD